MYHSPHPHPPPPPSIPREFDHDSYGVGNLITSHDIMLRVALIPYGLIHHGGGGGDKL